MIVLFLCLHYVLWQGACVATNDCAELLGSGFRFVRIGANPKSINHPGFARSHVDREGFNELRSVQVERNKVTILIIVHLRGVEVIELVVVDRTNALLLMSRPNGGSRTELEDVAGD